MKRPLLGITTSFCVGILLEQILDIPTFFIFAYASVFLFSSILFRKSTKRFFISILVGFAFLGALTLKNYNFLPQSHVKNIVSIPSGFSKQVVVQGKILTRPEKSSTFYKQSKQGFLLGVNAVRAGNNWKRSCGIIMVNTFNAPVTFQYGDEAILEGSLFSPRPATNPGQFDYKRFLERKKIFYILNARKGDFSRVIGHRWVNPVRLFAYKASHRIEVLIKTFMPDMEGSMLEAILLGKRIDVDSDINEDFVKTGTVHILAISGLHVGLLASMFILLFKIFRLPFKIWVLPLALLLIFYCVMVDNRPPVTRATIMILVFLFGRVLKREQDLLNTLAFSALVILFFNPNNLFDIGFQLSFLTVGSIVYFTPQLERIFIKRYYLPVPENGVRLYVLRLLLVSLSAWLGSAPLIARYFNIFSPITIIANLFIVPWMFFVLATSLTFILFGAFSYILGLVFSGACSSAILTLVKMASIFSKTPFSYFRVKGPPWIFIVGFYIFLFLFFNRGYLKIRAKYFLITGLVLFNVFAWHKIFFNEQHILKITFLDVGKGDAIVLQFPEGGIMLIDGGEALGADMGRLIVARFLSSEGINKVDAVILTHPHTDHVGGLAWVIKNFKIKYFIDNGDKEENPFYAETQKLVNKKDIKQFTVQEGDLIKGFGKTEIVVLNPPGKKFSDLNNNSLVFKIRYKNFSILFCADIREDAAKNLLLNERLASTVLKIPHHGGSLGNVTSEFLKGINPEVTVISMGNRKASNSILFAIKELRARVYRTDMDGAIFLTTDGSDYEVGVYKK